jgi:hypothetical protein
MWDTPAAATNWLKTFAINNEELLKETNVKIDCNQSSKSIEDQVVNNTNKCLPAGIQSFLCCSQHDTRSIESSDLNFYLSIDLVSYKIYLYMECTRINTSWNTFTGSYWLCKANI